jgi:hypothetical protein
VSLATHSVVASYGGVFDVNWIGMDEPWNPNKGTPFPTAMEFISVNISVTGWPSSQFADFHETMTTGSAKWLSNGWLSYDFHSASTGISGVLTSGVSNLIMANGFSVVDWAAGAFFPVALPSAHFGVGFSGYYDPPALPTPGPIAGAGIPGILTLLGAMIFARGRSSQKIKVIRSS